MVEIGNSQTEQALCDLLERFHHEQQGQRPKCSGYILPGLAVIKSQDVFTATEKSLCETSEGQKIVQSARRELRAITRRDIESRVGKLLSKSVQRSYYDLDVRVGEQIEVYIFV